MLRTALSVLLFAGLFMAMALSASSPLYARSKIKPQLKTPPKGTRLQVVTDRLTYNARTKIAIATGRTIITYGNYVLIASKVIYDKRNDRMKAIGSVHLREPGGNILQADVAQLQNRFRDGFARHLRLLLTNDSTITADYARRHNGTLTIYQHVTYTRCKDCLLADGTPLWQIKSAEVTHDEKEGTIYHKDVTFQFLGADILWLPGLSHPDPTVKRRTGFLVPTLNYATSYGGGLTVPYFINLAPNYDLTLLPMITTRQGPLLNAIWRHRLASGQYNVQAAGIYQLDTNMRAPGNVHWRGFVRSVGNFKLARHWSWGWDGTLMSDATFGRHYDLDDRTDLVNRLYLTGLKDRNYFSAEILHFKGLLQKNNNNTFPVVAPFLRHSIILDQPVLGGEMGFDSTFYSLHRASAVALTPAFSQGTDQTRAIIQAHWKRRMVSDAGLVFTPFARLRGDLYYSRNLPGAPSQTNTLARLLPAAGLDVRFPFIRSDENGQQIITPVAQIIAATNETRVNQIGNEDAISINFDESNLFLQNRFTGLDRYEGGTRANYGLMYSWLFNNGGFLRLSGGQSIHLAGRNSFLSGSGLNGRYSDLVAAIALQPNEYLQFNYQIRLDDQTFKPRSQEASMTGRLGNFSGSINYLNIAAAPNYGRPLRQHQIWPEVTYNISDRWSLFGSTHYDLKLKRFLRRKVGVAYHCDCFGLKLYYKESNASDRDARKSRSIFLSLEFKTLGSATVGSGI